MSDTGQQQWWADETSDVEAFLTALASDPELVAALERLAHARQERGYVDVYTEPRDVPPADQGGI